jgi:hypothetical protein
VLHLSRHPFFFLSYIIHYAYRFVNLDKDGWRRILGRWGFKGKKNTDGTMQGVRTPMEVFVTDIAREMPGMEYLLRKKH